MKKINVKKMIVISGILLLISTAASVVRLTVGTYTGDKASDVSPDCDTGVDTDIGSAARPIGPLTDKQVYDGLRHQTSNRVWNMNTDANKEFLTSVLGFEPQYGGSAGIWLKEQLLYLFDAAEKWYVGEYSLEEAVLRIKACPTKNREDVAKADGTDGMFGGSGEYEIGVEGVDICTIEYDNFHPEINGMDVWLDLICNLENDENTQGRISAVKVSGYYEELTPNFLFVRVNYDDISDKTVVYYCAATQYCTVWDAGF